MKSESGKRVITPYMTSLSSITVNYIFLLHNAVSTNVMIWTIIIYFRKIEVTDNLPALILVTISFFLRDLNQICIRTVTQIFGVSRKPTNILFLQNCLVVERLNWRQRHVTAKLFTTSKHHKGASWCWAQNTLNKPFKMYVLSRGRFSTLPFWTVCNFVPSTLL